jgi:Ca-activated chloride channel homolog
MSGMHFEMADKWIFWLLPLPILVNLFVPALKKRRTALIAPFFDRAAEASGQRPKTKSWVTKRNIFGWFGLVACWICLLAAASSPRYVGLPGKKIKTVRSFLIAADISFSMAQTDWVLSGQRASRWDAVKSIMKDFVKNRKSDQIGLVLFGTHAYLQAPLTTDLDAITWLLDQSEVGMAGQMTSIGEAIALSVSVFRQDTIKQKVMLLLTDGIDGGQGVQPLDAAEAAKRDSITIYTLGIGQAHGSGGYDLDEKTLKSIARVTGGEYFNAMNEGQLQEVYKALDKMQPVEYEEESYKPIQLLYMYPLALAIGLGLLFHLISGLVNLLRKNN